MTIILKSRDEIEQLRKAGQLVAETYEHLEPYIKPGVQTMELDRRAEEFIRRRGGKSTYKGYHPPGHPRFPATICVAINDVVVHSYPRKKQELKSGDIIGIDIGATLNGWVGDACKTYMIGDVDAESRRLVATAAHCLDLGLAEARSGNRLGDIGAVIQEYAEAQGFSVIRELCGHGVGRSLWEGPQVSHFGKHDTGMKLRPGMVFTVEPMINAGGPAIQNDRDGWTIRTRDGCRSAQFEHTVALTDRGTEILTLTEPVVIGLRAESHQLSALSHAHG